MKSVLLITTGGTIASQASDQGLRPVMSSKDLLGYAAGLSEHYRVDSLELLNLDSSNIQVDEWLTIARAIHEALPRYDGVVVTHGTDTMAYTASMLSFMLQGLKKPVVLTGSQMPIDNLLTDARNNLYTAFAAVEKGIPGVSLAFNRRIIAGCRAVKISTMGFAAFESVNAMYLGEVFADGMRAYVPTPTARELVAPVTLRDKVCRDVFLLKLIPGTRPELLRALCDLNYKGLVIEAFGAGGLQFVRSDLLDQLRALTDKGIPVVICSQCLYESCNLEIYEVGEKLLSCGVIPAGDMTTEAIVTKLMWALGQTDDLARIREIFRTNYCGEIQLG